MTRKHTLLALLAAVALSLPSLLAAAPPNDSFANRILLVGTNVVTAGTTRGATWEPWESSLGIPPASVWWSWTAPTDGIVAVEAVGATAPVRLSVLEGATPQELTTVGGLHRWLYPTPRSSQIAFPAFQGLSCAIVASVEDAVAGGESDFTLALTMWPRPANDAFADRFLLTGNEVTERVFLVGATPEDWERARPDWFPDLGEGWGPATAWWEWQAPSSGAVTVSLADDVSQLGGQAGGVSSQAALRMTVLIGRDPAQFSFVGQAGSWAPPYLATLTFDAVAGTTYQLALQGNTFPEDPLTVRIRYGQPPRVMLTQPLHGTEWRVGDVVPLQAHAASPDSAVREVEFQVAQNYDGFTPLATAGPGSFAANWSPTQAGVYRVLAVATDQRDLRTAAIPITIQVRPANDTFAHRSLIPPNASEAVGDLANATAQAVWWSWTAPQRGTFSIEATCAPGYWPWLAVFTGDSADRLTLVASNAFAGTDNTFLARVTFAAETGLAYALRASANAFQTPCPVNLRIVPSAPPSVSLLDPPYGTSFTNTPALLRAAATDPDDGVARVEFLLDDRLVGTATQPPYEVTIAPQSGPAGYAYVARAVDHFGLATRSETRLIYFYRPEVPPQPPVNDNFAERVALSGSSATVHGTTSNATREPDEPGPGFGSVWWSWTPDRSGYHTLELTSQGRNHVSVFEGATLATLKLLGCASAIPVETPGNPAFETQLTRLAIAVEGGKAYAVAIAAEFESEVGSFTLNVFPGARPEVSAQCTPEGPLTAGDSVDITAQASDLDGQVAAVIISVFGPTDGLLVTTNPPAPPYRLTLTNLVAGNYYVSAAALDDSGLSSDVASLGLRVVTPPPPNVEFPNRSQLAGAPVSATGSLEGRRVWFGWASAVSGEYTVTLISEAGRYPLLSVYRGSEETQLQLIGENAYNGIDDDTYSTRVTCAAEAGVEYAFALSAGTFGAGYEVRVNPSRPPVAHITQPTANSPIRGTESFTIVAEASDPEGRLARLDLYVDAEVVASFTQPPFRVVVPITQQWWEGRRIRALATDADGLQTWSASVWAEVYPTPPANDLFANAVPLSGFFPETHGRLGGATREPGEPVIATASDNGSVWYAWIAPAHGRVLITTDADHVSAGLYQGNSLGSLTRLAGSPVDAARQLVAPVVGGTTYYLGIEGSARWPRAFSLDLLLLPDPRGTLTASIGEDGALSIQGFGFPAVVPVLEMSTDLRAWVPVQTGAEGGVNFREPIERTVPQRFYRVAAQCGSAIAQNRAAFSEDARHAAYPVGGREQRVCLDAVEGRTFKKIFKLAFDEPSQTRVGMRVLVPADLEEVEGTMTLQRQERQAIP